MGVSLKGRCRLSLSRREQTNKMTKQTTIQLRVPSGFKLDSWWETAPETTIAKILHLVPTLVPCSDGSLEAKENEVKALETRLADVKGVLDQAVSSSAEKIEHVWRARLAEKEGVESALREQCSAFRSLHNEASAALQVAQRELSAANERHLRTVDQMRKEHQQRTDEMMLQLKQMPTAQQAGAFGETEVERIVADTLVCEVQDTSHEEGKGDRLVVTPSGMRMMLEVKSVERLHSKHDMEKFRRDAHSGVCEKRINAALLVSLKTESIPNCGPGPCHVTFMHHEGLRVPVISIATRSKAAIQIAVQIASHLRDLCDKEKAAKGGSGSSSADLDAALAERAILQKQLPLLCKHVAEADLALQTRIEMLSSLLSSAHAERDAQRDMHTSLLRLQQQIPWIVPPDAVEGDVAVDILLRHKEHVDEWLPTSRMTQSQRTAVRAAGGYKVVLRRAKEEWQSGKRQRTSEPEDKEGEEGETTSS